MTVPRSYLFVPGHRSDRFAKAAATEAHRIILDLEDAVGPDDKEMSRQNISQWFSGGGGGTVRINAPDTEWFAADVDALSAFPEVEIIVPKAEPASLSQAAKALPHRSFVALIETVVGLAALSEVAAAPRVVRLAFGNLDFGTDARIPDTGAALDPARFNLVIASRLANLPPPIDGVTVAFREEEVAADVKRVRAMGFGAKLCIHPRQVGPVNMGFSPDEDEIAWAQRIVTAIEESGGAAVQVGGKMVDKPMVERAKVLLQECGATEGGESI